MQAQLTELRAELDGLLRAEAYISSAVESAAVAETEGGEEASESDSRVRSLRRQVLALRRALYTLARASTPSPVVQQALLHSAPDAAAAAPVREAIEAAAARAPLPADPLEPPTSPEPAASDRLARRRAELDSRLGGGAVRSSAAATATSRPAEEPASSASSAASMSSDASAGDALFSFLFAPSVLVASTLTLATDAVLGLVGLDERDDHPSSPSPSSSSSH